MAGAVLCFMIMSLFHFPNKIIPTYLLFNFTLAWIVNANLETQKSQEAQINYQNNFKEQNTKNQWNKVSLSHGQVQNRWLIIVWIFAGIISVFFVGIYFQRYMAARQWHKAHELACTGKYQKAENIYFNIYPKLKWNGRFLFYYGNVLLQNEKYADAIKFFEKAKFTYPDPYMFENLGVAYVSVEIPQPPLKKGDYIDRAINYWILASNILPWRLTPKFYLADLFYQLDETNEAIKYARLVVNTPMKKWTERGKEFKLKSQKILIELGEECDDPGLIVFDIHDKKTWNEGKW